MGHQPAMGREGVNDVEELLARIAPWSRTFVLRTGPGVVDAAEREAAADPADAVYRGDVLADPGSGAAMEVIALHARARGMDPDPAAASLAFQRYAHRVAGVSVAAWAAGGLVLDLTAPSVWTVVRSGSPHHLVAERVRALPDGDLGTLVHTVVDEHLEPVARTWNAVSGLSMEDLHGNMAASFAAACRQLSKVLPADEMCALGEDILARRAELVDGGTFRILTGADGRRLFFDRSTCCSWHASPHGEYCSGCPHTSYEQRTGRFEAMLATDGH